MRQLDPVLVSLEVRSSLAGLDERFGGCLMCAIAQGGRDEELVVVRRPGVVVVLDRFAARPGHLMVVLEQHAEKVAAVEWEAWQALQRAAWEASRALEAVLQPTRTYVAALGAAKAMEKSWPHLHLHVVPLDDDGEAARPARVFSWRETLYGYEPGEAQALAARLRAQWPAQEAAVTKVA